MGNVPFVGDTPEMIALYAWLMTNAPRAVKPRLRSMDFLRQRCQTRPGP